jgi:hypothetical protein
MEIEFLKKLEKSKWLPWVGTAPFILVPVGIMFGGEVAQGAGVLAFFASCWVGILLGGKLARVISTHFLRTSEDFAKRLSGAFSAFGFLFLPVLVGSFANANLGTTIGLHSVGAHFLWSCVGAALFFSVDPSSPKDDSH